MKSKYINILILLLCSFPFYGQDDIDIDTTDKNEDELAIHFRPQISLGTGMFTFFGDVAYGHNGFHPTVSRLARDLRVSQALNPNFDLSFYVLFGQVSANERTRTRNLNFNSHISTGGATLTYNFYHILNPKRIINPYISLGVESMEFLSKSDLKDKNGTPYNYWSDGTIKDIAETDPNAANAVEIFRDYTYESDLREANLDGFGQYQERTMAIPLGIGVNMHLSKRIKARLGASMHFTFSDLIDNVSNQSEGARQGDNSNDKFLYTHFALTYDFGKRKNKEDLLNEDEDLTRDELMASDSSDYDGDGVFDFVDDCIKTPKHAFPVDEKGCPLDDDKDFVPNYRDDELNTLFGDLVNHKGVTQYDDDLERLFNTYIDSSGRYYIEERHVTTSGEEGLPREETEKIKNQLKYTIIIGSSTKEVSANELYKYLSYKEFKTIERGDSVFYVIGGFESMAEAIGEKENLELNGIKTDGIALIKGLPSQIKKVITNNEIKDLLIPSVRPIKESENSIYRVQIGAFRVKISNEAFSNVKDLEVVRGKDGLYRYYTGAFTKKEEAIEHKIDILEKGYSGAIITVFKAGKRISLGDAGFDVINEVEGQVDNTSEPTKAIMVKGLIKYKVQVGAYQNDIPTEVLDIYLQIGDVLPRLDNRTKITKYLVGKYDNYEDAKKRKEEIIAKGLLDAFIVADLNGNIISTSEALELTK